MAQEYISEPKNLFVHPNGNNEDGLSWFSAHSTIQKAFNSMSSGNFFSFTFASGAIIQASGGPFSSGTTINEILVSSGNYTENVQYTNPSGFDTSIEFGYNPGEDNSDELPSGVPTLTLIQNSFVSVVTSTGTIFDFAQSAPSGSISISNITASGGDIGFNFVDNLDVSVSDINVINNTGTGINFDGAIFLYNNIFASGNGIGINALNATGILTNDQEFVSVVTDNTEYGIFISSGDISSLGRIDILNNPTGIYHQNASGFIFNLSSEDSRVKSFNNDVHFYLDTTDLFAEYLTAAVSGQVFNTVGVSGAIKFCILESSGVPVASGSSNVVTISESCVFDKETAGQGLLGGGYTLGIGNIFQDPKFTAVNSGDLRLDVDSPCIGAAEDIFNETFIFHDLNIEAVKVKDDSGFFPLKEYAASGFYLINGGRTIYLSKQPSEALNQLDQVTVLINQSKEQTAKIVGQQSFSLASGVKDHPFPLEYRIVKIKNPWTDKEMDHLIPYTIFDLSQVLSSGNVANVEFALQNLDRRKLDVRTFYDFTGIAYDEDSKDEFNQPVLWILERNNQLLFKQRLNDRRVIQKFPLFCPNPVSYSGNLTVVASGILPHGEHPVEGYEFTPIFDGINQTGSPRVTARSSRGNFPWIPYDLDIDQDIPVSGVIYRDVRGLIYYAGFFHILDKTSKAKNQFFYPGFSVYPSGDITLLHTMDSFREHKFCTIPSGLQLLNSQNPTDITIDRDENFLVSEAELLGGTSGIIQKYIPKYDYAFVQNDNRNKSTIYYRERYPSGVSIHV